MKEILLKKSSVWKRQICGRLVEERKAALQLAIRTQSNFVSLISDKVTEYEFIF